MTFGGSGGHGGRCPEDGELVAYLDGALEEEVRERMERHVETCGVCRERLREIEGRSDRVGAWLARHDPQAPPRTSYELHRARGSGSGRRWGLAAGIVLAVALAAGPARGWLLERLGWRGAPDAPAGETTRVEEGAATSFAPAGTTLTLSFGAGVRGRRILLEPSGDSLVTLRAPGPDVALVVGPGRVDVRDAGTSGREYRLALPQRVERVVIRVPGADSLVVLPDAGGAPTTVAVPTGSGE